MCSVFPPVITEGNRGEAVGGSLDRECSSQTCGTRPAVSGGGGRGAVKAALNTMQQVASSRRLHRPTLSPLTRRINDPPVMLRRCSVGGPLRRWCRSPRLRPHRAPVHLEPTRRVFADSRIRFVTEHPESRLAAAVHHLQPGYFALVMATGIISLGFHLRGFDTVSMVLLVITAAAYAVLVVMLVWRVIRYPRAVLTDLASPHNGFAFFTFVAGTNVLGARLAAEGIGTLPAVLLGVSFAAWLFLGYAIPALVVGKHPGDDLLRGLNGTWFVWPVASQSVAVMAAGLQQTAGGMADALSILAILSWGIGIMLYGIIGTALVIRILTRGIPPEQWGPPYWVMMGAGAISVLAGSRIVEMDATPMVEVMRAPVAAAAVVFWAFCTWLIPALFGIGYWRHFMCGVPLRYEPGFWSMIFPLGMYSVAGIYLGRADELPLVGWIGGHFLWIALTAWLIVFVAMVISLFRAARSPRTQDVASTPK